jgi:Bacterial low temperature requirement A protein (LtrA)
MDAADRRRVRDCVRRQRGHLLIVAGIIVAAVADEFVLAHPTGHIDLETTVAVLSGPALFLVGNILFKRTTADRLPLSHLVGFASGRAFADRETPRLDPGRRQIEKCGRRGRRNAHVVLVKAIASG